jgi:beta-fructofuranosidase
MALPREVSAGENGSLAIKTVESVLESMFSALPSFNLPKLSLESIGNTATQFLDKVKCERPYLIKFNVQHVSAASFGLIFDVDVDLKGCYLRFVPTYDDRYTVSLALAPAPLDDFWSDQYQLYLPRGVDGSEVVRHENVRINDPVAILRSGDTVEVFVGGRVMSYRLLGSAAAAEKKNSKAWDIGVFVEDGRVHFLDFKVTEGMDY